jgi:hypothetical protein
MVGLDRRVHRTGIERDRLVTETGRVAVAGDPPGELAVIDHGERSVPGADVAQIEADERARPRDGL